MTLGQWLKSLSGLDHGILVVLYFLGIYLSKITLEALIEFYDIKKQHSKFRVQFRGTSAALRSLAFIYSFLIYQVLDAMFGFMP